jgi:hypothetical protein
MPSGTLYCVAVFRTDVSENVSSQSSGFLRLIGFHSCVISLSIEGYYLWSKSAAFWEAFMVVSVIDAF